MKTTVEMMMNGMPVINDAGSGNKAGYWQDHGSAYTMFGILDALGLPTPIDIIVRESKQVNCSGSNNKHESEYAPDWRALLKAFEILETSIKSATALCGDLLVLMIKEDNNTIYAEHPIKSGLDALAKYVDAKEHHEGKKVRGAQNRFGHFYFEDTLPVRSIVRGVTYDINGVCIPCVYVIFEGNINKLINHVKMWEMMCEIALADAGGIAYTIRVITEKNDSRVITEKNDSI